MWWWMSDENLFRNGLPGRITSCIFHTKNQYNYHILTTIHPQVPEHSHEVHIQSGLSAFICSCTIIPPANIL